MLQGLIHLISLLKKINALKLEVVKLEISKLINAPTSLNNLKTKVDDLDFGKLRLFQ